nr:MAG: hypothetical protein E4H34_04075 [Hyphomicrobiales bacterium]
MTRTFWTLALACLFALATGLGLAPASAHHSRAAYDRNTQVSITGTVKAFEYSNPHAWIYVVVTKPDGRLENWDFEGGSPRRLDRVGWSKDMLAEGDTITIDYNPKRDGSPGGIFRGITTADGILHSTARNR